MLRTFLERISRNVVLRRQMPARAGGGPIYVSPDSALKFWKRNMEGTDPALFDWAAEFVKAGDVVWDIGANVGLFTFAAANASSSNGYVLAVEADLRLVEILRRSVRCQKTSSARVVTLPVAVSDEVDVAEFAIASRGRSANHLVGSSGSSQTGGNREVTTSMTVTLDWLLEKFPSPALVKIDVEGAEQRVLQGAEKLFTTIRPRFLCEVQAENRLGIAEIFATYNYKMFDLESPAVDRVALDLPAFNTLAVPRETV